MNNKSKNTSLNTMQETWDLKERAYLEVAHLDLRTALRTRLQNSIKTSNALFPAQKEENTGSSVDA